MRVLIAEDDAVSRIILRRAVEKLGHECLAAADGIGAWATFQENADVDVIISDWMMPGMDGHTLCKNVRNYVGTREGYPFFVFLTALGDKQHLLEGMQAGADDYLKKPLDRDELEVRLLAAERVTSLHRQLSGQKKELEKLNFELFKQARRDPLTRLGNRLLLREDLKIVRARAERYGHAFCALMCDIDSFGPYNNAHGHLAGDDVLRQVAHAILKTFRAGDVSYRYGGEEFLVILPEQSLETAAIAAERLRREIEALAIPHEASPTGFLTVSCGLAGLEPGSTKTFEELLREADEALYAAKQDGKNSVALHGGPPADDDGPRGLAAEPGSGA